MNKTSQRPSPRFTDARQAAKVKLDDFGPLIRIVDDAAQKTQPNESPKVLYLKHHVDNMKCFITTDSDTPLQHPSERASPASAQDLTQRIAARDLVRLRGDYWANKLQKNPEVTAAATALIGFCDNPDQSGFGLACTATLRDLIQDLHNALPSQAHKAHAQPQHESPDDKKKGRIHWPLRASHTQHTRHTRQPPDSGKQETLGHASPEQHSAASTPRSPRTEVSGAAKEESHFLPVSPRKSTSQPASKPTSPRLGGERAHTPRDEPHSPSVAPNKPLPPTPHPITATPTAVQAPGAEQQHKLDLSAFERHRPHPQPLLRSPRSSQQTSGTNTPATTSPREEDKH